MIDSNDKLNNDDTIRGKLRASEDWNALITELMNVAKIKTTFVDTTKSDVLTNTLITMANDRIFDATLIGNTITINSNQTGRYVLNGRMIIFFRGKSTFTTTSPISIDGITKYTRNEDGTKPPDKYIEGLLYVAHYFGGFFRVGKWIIGKSGIEHNWFGTDSISILDERTKGTGVNNVIIGRNTNNLNFNGNNNNLIGYGIAPKLSSGQYNVGVGTKFNVISTGSRNIGLGVSLSKLTSGGDNVAIGYNSLMDVTTATDNIGIGASAGKVVVGKGNVYIGNSAGSKQVTDNYNVAIGYQASIDGTKGTGNVAMGAYSGKNITGSYNLALGYSNLTSCVGSHNIALGSETLKSVGSGSGNIGIGRYACLSGNYNVSIGYSSGLKLTTSSSNNIILGNLAGETITTAINNVCIGKASGKGISTYGDNITIGTESYASSVNGVSIGTYAYSTGRTAVSIGYKAGYLCSSTLNSVVIGNEASKSSSSTVTSVNIGMRAGSNGKSEASVNIGLYTGEFGTSYQTVNIGPESGQGANANSCVLIGKYVGGNDLTNTVGIGSNVYRNASANNSVAIGTEAGDSTDNESSVAIGPGAGRFTNTDTCLFIGSRTSPGIGEISSITNSAYILARNENGTGYNGMWKDNMVMIGNPTTEFLWCAVNLSKVSDRRDKENIKPQPDVRDIINSLNPVTFTWNKRVNNLSKDYSQSNDRIKGTDVKFGFIAQDFQQLIEDFPILNGSGILSELNEDYLGIDTEPLISLLVNNVKTLNEENKAFRKELDELKALIKMTN